ncbi:unnamed protein product [Ranitomeya imitator]|uniref:DUF3528 domain-containing protein n=1 Tax=Ranitomeya imitator TaxID=111125 RepID=A0ABN9L9M2_9NEOB|nr:unnamed protein product [Ranitomeya imitator]
MPYSYSSNLAQVQPVREVTFREYAIDTSSKWHPRSNLPHCYSADDILHRDCTGSAAMGNSSNVYHPNANVPSNFYSTVGRNGVLPQAFDQFFETAYGSPDNNSQQPSDYSVDKHCDKMPGASATTSSSEPCREAEEKERRTESSSSSHSSSHSSSGNNEDKANVSSTYESSLPCLSHRLPCLSHRLPCLSHRLPCLSHRLYLAQRC